MKSTFMWAILGKYGLYAGTRYSRKDAISEYCHDLGVTWKYCRSKGDRAVRVRVTPIVGTQTARRGGGKRK